MLLLHASFEGKEIILGSLYGPNTNEERFFYNLNNHLQNLPCKIKILGGDMNLTLDPSNVNVNLDVLNMANIPSLFRSEKMIEIKNRFNLVDPYRSLHPNRREYTFLPSAQNLQNRSRIDFFLVNVESIPFVRNCTIPHSLLSTHFDHKMISLSFKKVKNPKNYPIKNNILLEVEVNWQIKASVIETYIHHAEITENFTLEQKNGYLLNIGQILGSIATLLDLKTRLTELIIDNELEHRVLVLKRDIEDIFEQMPNLEFFEGLRRPEYCNDVLFFDTLVHCIRNGALLQQKKNFELKRKKKRSMEVKLKNLKSNYTLNSREINDTERLLNNLIESELKEEILANKKFEVLNDEKMTTHFASLAKVAGSDDKISDIRDENGNDF